MPTRNDMRHDGHVRVRSSAGAENVRVDATGRCIRRTAVYRRHSGTFVLCVNGARSVTEIRSIGKTKKYQLSVVGNPCESTICVQNIQKRVSNVL